MPDNEERVLFRVGTKADYNALEEKLNNILYFITDTGELYKGTTLISTKQRVFNYTAIVPSTATAADVFILAAGADAEKVVGDIVLWRKNNTIMTGLWTGTTWVILNERIAAQNVILSNGKNLETALSESALGAVDDETIVNHNNALSLKGFEVEYYTYNTSTQQYVKVTVDATHPWRDGLVPRIITYNNNLIFGWVVAEDVSALAREVADLQVLNASNTQRISALESTVGSIFTYRGEAEELNELSPVNGDVYTVDNKNYVWNGTEWIETADVLSGYATDREVAAVDSKVTTLESLVGKPAELDSVSGEMKPATGLFADYISNVKVGNINLIKTNNTVTLPTFNGVASGLVPVYSGNGNKSSLVLNALGEWVTAGGAGGMDSRIGDLTINNIQYNTVEEYVQTAVDAVVLRWEAINN